MTKELFINIAEAAIQYRQSLLDRPVGVTATHEQLLANFKTDLPEEGEAPDSAIRTLIAGVEPGLIHNASARYFGFVIGGATPVSVAADWLTSVWNQNAQVYLTSPAAAIVEEIVAQWLLDLLGLPPESGVGLVTGTQMAHFTALSIARNVVLQKQGWNADAQGLQGAPRMHIICGECCHATIHSAVRMIGLGTQNIQSVPADEQGRMRLDEFKKILAACTGPIIVCVYAALRNLGKKGVWELVDNCCDMARFFAAELSKIPHARVLNEVVLNQVLCRLEPPEIRDLDAFNAALAARIQQEGVCWIGTTQWHNQTALRISVSNWSTTRDDVKQSIDSLVRAVGGLTLA